VLNWWDGRSGKDPGYAGRDLLVMEECYRLAVEYPETARSFSATDHLPSHLADKFRGHKNSGTAAMNEGAMTECKCIRPMLYWCRAK